MTFVSTQHEVSARMTAWMKAFKGVDMHMLRAALTTCTKDINWSRCSKTGMGEIYARQMMPMPTIERLQEVLAHHLKPTTSSAPESPTPKKARSLKQHNRAMRKGNVRAGHA